MTKLRYPFGGGAAVRQPCASCTGASHEPCLQPLLQTLSKADRRALHNDGLNRTAKDLAWDNLETDYRLHDSCSGFNASSRKYRWCLGDCPDCGPDAGTQSLGILYRDSPIGSFERKRWRLCNAKRWADRCIRRRTKRANYWYGTNQTHVDCQQVRLLLHVAASQLIPKGVLV